VDGGAAARAYPIPTDPIILAGRPVERDGADH